MKKLLTILTFAVVGSAYAQEEASKLNVSGSVDAYFRANLSSSNDGDANTVLGTQGDFSAFNNDSGFSLGLANVTLSYEGEKVGFIADLAVGQRADQYNGDGAIVNEAYMYWNVSEKTTLQMGRFNSWMGYEELSAANNFHYSMSHMFTYSARNFNGLVARFDLGNDFGLGLGLMNPVNVIEGNQNNNGAYSIAAGLWKGNTSISFASSQETSYIDFKTAFKVSESFNVALNAHIADYEENPQAYQPGSGFTSISAYPQIKSSDSMTWGMRLEYITFEDFANDLSVFTPTLTANYTVGALTIIPELRLDSASEDVFTDNDGEAAGGLTAFTLGAVYSF